QPVSIVFDAIGNFYVGLSYGTGGIEKYNSAGQRLTTYYVPTPTGYGNFLDLSSDQHTLFYTDEGPMVKRYDVSGPGAIMTPFANLGAGTNAMGIKLLPPG